MPPASFPALAAINPGPSTVKSLRIGEDRLRRKRDRACFLRSARSVVLSFSAFWSFDRYMNGSGGSPSLVVWRSNSSNTETKVRTTALTYSMRHSTGNCFTDRTILFNDLVRDTHLLFDFDTIRRHSTNEVFRTN